ncbi:MAG: hypothetical protein RLZZ283_234 [Candidatus Parcubacteria bacterium]|jgi:hypothetical protein
MDHKKPEEDLQREIEEAQKQITVGAKYEHYKSADKTYTVLGFVVIESEIGVLYHANYGKNLTFVRPVREWLDPVDGKPRYRKL